MFFDSWIGAFIGPAKTKKRKEKKGHKHTGLDINIHQPVKRGQISAVACNAVGQLDSLAADFSIVAF